MESVALGVLLSLLFALSAFFSASETALTAFSRSKVKEIAEKNPRKAILLKKWLKNPNMYLSAILIGNNLVNLLSSSLATAIALKTIGDKPEAIVIATLIITLTLLIFGELTPKVVAKAYSTQIASGTIVFIHYLSTLLLPLSVALIFISRLIARLFGVKLSEVQLLITEEDIKSAVTAGEEEGVIETEEKQMIHSIFEFGDTTVKEVMIHRTSVFCLDGSKTLDETWDGIDENGYSRIPVYLNTIDNIIGVLYQKDLFKPLKENATNSLIKDLIRDAYFVPETKPLLEMLEDFKKKQIHMAIVIDEYGGMSGIVTIEDLMEEIVGDIRDEFDVFVEENIVQVAESKFVVNAMLNIDEINEALQINLPESDDYDSLGGYINATLGRIPLEGDVVTTENEEIIRILQIRSRRVVKALITKKQVDDV